MAKETAEAARHYRQTILQAARTILGRSTQRMVALAFASDVNHDGVLSWAEFESFASEQPQFVLWSTQLGLACLESVAMIEDRSRLLARDTQNTSTNTSSAPSSSSSFPATAVQSLSTARARRRFPDGSPWTMLRVMQVEALFSQHATYGRLNPDQFASLLRKLFVRSPYTVRRLFTLFDRDGGGDVSMAECGAGFFLLCGGGLPEKLSAGFNMFDSENAGFLERAQLQSFLEALCALAMDVICCSLSTFRVVLSPAPELEDLVLASSYERVQHFVAQKLQSLERYCVRDHGKYFFAEFLSWAEGDGERASRYFLTWGFPQSFSCLRRSTFAASLNDVWCACADLPGTLTGEFMYWVDAIKNMWLESLVDAENAAGTMSTGHRVTKPSKPTGSVGGSTVGLQQAIAHGAVRGDIATDFGPPGIYGYRYTVKHRPFAVAVSSFAGVKSKLLPYSNPGATELHLSLHTDSPALLSLPQREGIVIPPMGETKLRLRFELPPPRKPAQVAAAAAGR